MHLCEISSSKCSVQMFIFCKWLWHNVILYKITLRQYWRQTFFLCPSCIRSLAHSAEVSCVNWRWMCEAQVSLVITMYSLKYTRKQGSHITLVKTVILTVLYQIKDCFYSSQGRQVAAERPKLSVLTAWQHCWHKPFYLGISFKMWCLWLYSLSANKKWQWCSNDWN